MFACILQRVGHLKHVLEQNIIVANVVDQHQFAFEVLGFMYRGRIAVAFFVFLRCAQVTLGVDGVVEEPIGNGCAADAGLDELGFAQHRVESHVAAIAPAGHADAGWVDKAQRDEVFDASFLILYFDLAKFAVELGFPEVAATAGASIVHLPDYETFVGQHLIEISAAVPCVADGLSVRTSIDHDDGRVFLCGVEVLWFDEPGVEGSTVFYLEAGEFGGEDIVLFERATV